eukprot:28171-Pleurochrysis_carterae.AAC.1
MQPRKPPATCAPPSRCVAEEGSALRQSRADAESALARSLSPRPAEPASSHAAKAQFRQDLDQTLWDMPSRPPICRWAWSWSPHSMLA